MINRTGGGQERRAMTTSGRMGRRVFLGTAGAGVAAGWQLLAGEGRPSAPSPRHGFKKAVKFGMVRVKGSLLDKFKLLKEVGFDGVELDSPSGLDRKEVLRARD